MKQQHLVISDDIHAAIKSAASEAKLDIKEFVEAWFLLHPEVKAALKRMNKP